MFRSRLLNRRRPVNKFSTPQRGWRWYILRVIRSITNEKTAIISLRFNRVNQTPTRSTCNLRTTPISPFCHPCALPRFTIIINYSEHKNIFNDKALCLQWKFASYMFIGESRQSLRVNNNRKVMWYFRLTQFGERMRSHDYSCLQFQVCTHGL